MQKLLIVPVAVAALLDPARTISLIGVSRCSRQSSVSTVSYATALIPQSTKACVSGSSTTMWR